MSVVQVCQLSGRQNFSASFFRHFLFEAVKDKKTSSNFLRTVKLVKRLTFCRPAGSEEDSERCMNVPIFFLKKKFILLRYFAFLFFDNLAVPI